MPIDQPTCECGHSYDHHTRAMHSMFPCVMPTCPCGDLALAIPDQDTADDILELLGSRS